MNTPKLSEEFVNGGIEALIIVLWEIQPLIGNDPELHKKFHEVIWEGWTSCFGLTKEDVDQRLDDALEGKEI